MLVYNISFVVVLSLKLNIAFAFFFNCLFSVLMCSIALTQMRESFDFDEGGIVRDLRENSNSVLAILSEPKENQLLPQSISFAELADLLDSKKLTLEGQEIIDRHFSEDRTIDD
jgi:hypothetical protein